MSNDTNDFLFGGGSRAAKFENLGDMIEGTITAAEVAQQTSMEDNTPLTWADGSPRKQLIVTLATAERVDDEDDGLRRIFAKGGKFEVAEGRGTSMKDAIAEAVKKSGAGTLAEGGSLTVGYTGIGKRTNRGYAPPKLFSAKYIAPKASVAESDLFD